MIISQFKQNSGTKEYWKKEWEKESFAYQMNKPQKMLISGLFLKYLPKNKRIIEAGAGAGKHVYFLTNKGYDIIGIDYEEDTIKKVKKEYPKLKLYYDNVFNLNYKNNSFGAYISLGVIEHYANYEQILKEANRVLEKNGLLLLTVPTINLMRYMFYPYTKLKNLYYKHILKYPFHQYIFSRNYIFNILNKNGFNVLKDKFRFLEKNHMGFYLAIKKS